jgi:hypothetical protein
MIGVRDVAPGLWIWQVEHPAWNPGLDWGPTVTSTCVESGSEVALLDPLAPNAETDEVSARLEASPPSMVVILKPDHVRDVDRFVQRYGSRAFGPYLFWRGDVPQTELEPIDPDMELPGGLRTTLYDTDGARRGAPRLGDALARGASCPRAQPLARSSVRARHCFPRGAGSRPCGIRARASAGALGVIAGGLPYEWPRVRLLPSSPRHEHWVGHLYGARATHTERDECTARRDFTVDEDIERHTVRPIRDEAARPERNRPICAASGLLRAGDEGNSGVGAFERDLSLRQRSIAESRKRAGACGHFDRYRVPSFHKEWVLLPFEPTDNAGGRELGSSDHREWADD